MDSTADDFAIYLKAAARAGLPVEGYDPSALANRRLKASIAGKKARQYVEDLSAWIDDDDPLIRKESVDALRRCLYQAGITEHNERVSLTSPPRVVVMLRSWLQRCDSTRDSYWWESWERVRVLRRLAAVLTCVLALTASLAFVIGRPLMGIAFMTAMGLVSFSDRWLAQATRHESSYWPWLACVLGHLCDMTILTAIGIHLEIHAQDMAGPVFLAAGASLMAAFVRVSALQTGLRFFWNPKERVVRWVSVGVFGLGATLERPGGAAAALVSILGLAALVEIWLVLFRGLRSSKKHTWPRLLVLQRENGRAFTRDPQEYGGAIESEDCHHLLTQ